MQDKHQHWFQSLHGEKSRWKPNEGIRVRKICEELGLAGGKVQNYCKRTGEDRWTAQRRSPPVLEGEVPFVFRKWSQQGPEKQSQNHGQLSDAWKRLRLLERRFLWVPIKPALRGFDHEVCKLNHEKM